MKKLPRNCQDTDLIIWAEPTWEPPFNDEVLKALAQTGTDSLPEAVREVGFGAIDSAASAVLGAFPGKCSTVSLIRGGGAPSA